MKTNRTALQLSLPLAALAMIAGFAAAPASAAANTGKFKLGVGRIAPFACKIGGPTDFRDARVTNNTKRIYRRGRAHVYWQAKIGGQVKSGRTRLWTDLGPGGTIAIPLGTGGGGYCEARIFGR